MVGNGSKIGAGPRVPAGAASSTEVVSAVAKEPTVQSPADRFSNAGAPKPREGGGVPPLPMSDTRSATTDVFRLARQNPAVARQLVASMQKHASQALGKIQQEMAAARVLLEQLGAERFSKKACEKQARQMARHREQLKRLKARHRMLQRKMALIQQLAGRVGESPIEESLNHFFEQHRRLRTRWGRRYHLLNLAEELGGGDEETPEHLRGVYAAGMRVGIYDEGISETMSEVSPKRVIAELIARTLDGSSVGVDETKRLLREVEKATPGKVLQSWVALRKVMLESVGEDPLKKDT